MRRPLKTLLAAVVAVALPIALYAAYVAWDMRRLQSFCDDIPVGTPIDRIAAIAIDHGIDPKGIIDARTFPEAARDQSMLVAAGSTMGEMSCDIQLDATRVISATVYGP